MCMNGCHQHLTHAGPAHADPANPDQNVTNLWDKQEEVIIGLFALYTTSEVYNQVASDIIYPTVHDKYQHLDTLYGLVGSMATFVTIPLTTPPMVGPTWSRVVSY